MTGSVATTSMTGGHNFVLKDAKLADASPIRDLGCSPGLRVIREAATREANTPQVDALTSPPNEKIYVHENPPAQSRLMKVVTKIRTYPGRGHSSSCSKEGSGSVDRE